MLDLYIEADPDELQAIREEIDRVVGPSARLEPVASSTAGELREPIIIGLIVALGGEEVVRAVVKILRDRQLHKERLAEIEAKHTERLVELILREGDKERPITLEELENLKPAGGAA